ncbi:MAG: hypothetical protein AAGB22_03000, partial [Bacteroidota bacterium]
MKRLTVFFSIVGLLFLLVACPSQETTEVANPGDTTGCTITPTLSSNIPHEVSVILPDGYSGLDTIVQVCFDAFSWEEFVALNWPANSDGTPQSGQIGSDPTAKRVWEYYLDAEVVFDPGTQLVATNDGNKGLFRFSKGFLSSGDTIALHNEFTQATTQPLVDQNGNYVLYEIKLNNDEVTYLDTSGLTTLAGQQAKTVNFPAGSEAGLEGAIEVKATWKLLGANDDTSKYYTREANITIDPQYTASGQTLHVTAEVALVAMHIIHKTERFPAWIWTSFQHKDNQPVTGETPNGTYAFYDPACPSDTCPINTPPDTPYVWQDTMPYAGANLINGHGTQVVQMLPIPDYTEGINAQWQALLQGTVWANYELLGSQWQVVQDIFPADTVDVPTLHSNAVVETYFQQSSCLSSCHTLATDAAGKNADFSFVLLLGLQEHEAEVCIF